MSVAYRAVQWNRQKLIYDGLLLTGVVVYIGGFLSLAPLLGILLVFGLLLTKPRPVSTLLGLAVLSLLRLLAQLQFRGGREIHHTVNQGVGLLRGIPDFTLVPPNSRLLFEGGVVLTVDLENGPCRYPAEKIEEAHPGHGAAFPQKARHKRGVTAWVEKPGQLKNGETCRLHVPPQRIYAHV